MDAKRIIIFVVLLAVLVWAGMRACERYNQLNPTPPPPPVGTTPAP